MQHTPSVRAIRDALLAQSRATSIDPVALDSLRADVRACVEAVRTAMDRAMEFAARGLVGEAASIVADYPELARQASMLAALPTENPTLDDFWRRHIDVGAQALALPSGDEVDRLAALLVDADCLRPQLDRLRTAALRGEPITVRLQLLKQLREADPRNRMWLDQIAMLEREWLKRLGELAGAPADREELEDALAALASRTWLATVPAGLRDALYAKVRPLRAAQAGERYAALADEIHRAASLMDRTALERLEGEWAAIYHDTGRMPDEPVQASVAPAFEWLSAVIAEEQSQAEFDAKVDELDRALDARRPWTEIDVLLSGLRDAGRSVPDGVLARAGEWIRAEQDRLRRRHRLVLTGAVAAALVVALGTTLAIVIWSRTTASRDAAKSLESRIAAEDEPGVRTLVEEIKARPELASVEVSAALVKAEEFAKAWAVARASVSARVARLEAALAAPAIARADFAGHAEELASIASTARIESEKSAAAAIEQTLARRKSELDARDRAAVDAAMQQCEARLAGWKLPDRWSDAEQVDPARWVAYAEALDASRGELERAIGDVAGFESQESRLKLAIDGIKTREDEAKSRRQELAIALVAIAPAAIGKPVTSEQDFIDRLEAVLSTHAATLERLGQIAGWERARTMSAAWLAIKDWREKTRPELATMLGAALSSMPSPDMRDKAVAVLQEHRGRFPESPYGSRADELLRRLDPGARNPIWEPTKVVDTLRNARYGDLEEVPLESGGLFYRRPSPTNKDPMHRAVDSLGELREDPEKLGAMILRGDAIGGPVRRSAVSQAWGDALLRIESARPGEVASILTTMLATIAKGTEGDSLFRIRALRDGAELAVNSGHFDVPVAQAVEAWLELMRREAAEIVSIDWARAACENSSENRAARRKSSEMIRRFPELSGMVGTAEEAQRRLGAQLAALAPIGVLLVATPDGGDRVVAGDPPGRPVADGEIVLLVRDGTRWRMQDARVRDGRIANEGLDVPSGPVLVFRRVSQ